MLLTKTQIELFVQAVDSGRIKVGVFDLETSYTRARVWDTGKQWISAEQLLDQRQIITAQFLDCKSKKPEYKIWKKTKAGFDDTNVLKWICKKLNECDIVIAQNGKGFDYKVLQEALMLKGLDPIEIDFMIDTLVCSRASVKSFSHSLDSQSKQLGFGGKVKMTMDSWIDIIERGESPLKEMVPYGLKDVVDTNNVFWKKLPYYNLSKATVNKLLKLITGQITSEKKIIIKEPKIICTFCRKKRHKATDITKGKCNTCGSKKHVKRD